MSAKTMLGAMIAGSVLVVMVGTRRSKPPRAPVVAPHIHERPWLTREAAAEIFGDGGTLGPLFADVSLGGPAPSQATRARIDQFARDNAVDIRFEVADGDLVAIRFAVTFGGCCGYEGADTLARRLNRPREERCIDCELDWVDDWTTTTSDGVYLRGRVRVNRVEVRWEPMATLPELLDRAESVLGRDRASVRRSATDRFIDLYADRSSLEVPYPLDDRHLGIELTTERGRIADVSFELREPEDRDAFADALRARWGRPRIAGEDPVVSTWQTPDHRISVESDGSHATFTMSVAR